MKHHVVVLDNWYKPLPLDFDYDISIYDYTTTEELPSRMKEATIVITTATKITRAGIEAAPNLQLINANTVGYDHIDLEAARDRGVTVCNVPHQNTDSVSEHAFALYYAIRRRIVPLHAMVMDGTIWAKDVNAGFSVMQHPPRTNAEETLVVIGYGSLGKDVEKIAKALGMRVLIAEHKGAESVRPGHTPFNQAIREGTVFIVVAPSDPSTQGMITAAELEAMNPTALLVNAGRGGVVDERDLVAALKDGQIAGAGLDVFKHEPATKETCPLLDPSVPNLVLTPHIAAYSSKTITGTRAAMKSSLEAFVKGEPVDVIVEGKRT